MATSGGQYYKQAPGAFGIKNAKAEGRQYAEGVDLIRRLAASTVEVMLGTLLWGIFDERTLALCRDERTEEIRAKTLVLAPGAQEVPLAFPGWTLPGVMMGGGVQVLVGSQRILPGHRAVMAGAGPLQLKVAAQLTDAGVEVVEVLEASRKSPLSMGNALRAFGHGGKMREGSRGARGSQIWLDRITRSGKMVGEQLRAYAERRGMTGAQLALLWVKEQPGITAPIVGPRTRGHLQVALSVMEQRLDPADAAFCDSLVPPGSAVVDYHNTSRWMKMGVAPEPGSR